MELLISFDGFCWPNPGGKAGYGWLAEEVQPDGSSVRVKDAAGPVEGSPTTNNLAEWRALEAALTWAANERPGKVVIRGDSQLVIKQLNGEWKCKKAELGAIRDHCLSLLKGIPWEARWVPREQNGEADSLSERGAVAT